MPVAGTRLRPRKRARQQRSTQTVEAILTAAARILERGGLEAANTNAIAALAGVSIGSLYQYFPNRDAILFELLRRAERRMADALAEAIDATKELPFAARLKLLIAGAVRQQFERPALARALDYFESRAPADPDLEAIDQEIVERLAGFLSALQPPMAHDRRVEAAGDLLTIVKAMVDAASAREEQDLVRLEGRLTHAVFGYLGMREPARGCA